MDQEETFSCLLFVHWSNIYKKKIQRKDRFAPIDSHAKTGPAVKLAVCRENSDGIIY